MLVGHDVRYRILGHRVGAAAELHFVSAEGSRRRGGEPTGSGGLDIDQRRAAGRFLFVVVQGDDFSERRIGRAAVGVPVPVCCELNRAAHEIAAVAVAEQDQGVGIGAVEVREVIDDETVFVCCRIDDDGLQARRTVEKIKGIIGECQGCQARECDPGCLLFHCLLDLRRGGPCGCPEPERPKCWAAAGVFGRPQGRPLRCEWFTISPPGPAARRAETHGRASRPRESPGWAPRAQRPA